MIPHHSTSDLILDSGALSIWDREKGPIFWYALGVPGPFYLNTELMIGRELSVRILTKIDAILAESADPSTRAHHIEKTILAAYSDKSAYHRIVSALADKAREIFPPRSYTLVSGGERRDWLFSIPFAHEIGVRHLFLFKDQSSYCKESVHKDEHVLHVADLINNAASYFDNWLPMLTRLETHCVGTAAVNVRGEEGQKRLSEAGCKIAALNIIDAAFFDECRNQGLIDEATRDELTLFLKSNSEWASRYLMDRPELFETKNIDAKSRARLKSFFAKDPWNLRPAHEDFFRTMLEKIGD